MRLNYHQIVGGLADFLISPVIGPQVVVLFNSVMWALLLVMSS